MQHDLRPGPLDDRVGAQVQQQGLQVVGALDADQRDRVAVPGDCEPEEHLGPGLEDLDGFSSRPIRRFTAGTDSETTRAMSVRLALTAAVTCAAPAQAAPGTRGLDALAHRTVRAGAPGVAVRVSGPGTSVGLARQAAWTGADHRLSADDQFRMASNTKTVVGTVALQLVAEHRLSLDDEVGKWLPGLVPNRKRRRRCRPTCSCPPRWAGC